MALDDILKPKNLSERKQAIIRQNHEYLMPGRVETWLYADIPLVIGKREGYRFWDVDGHELQDFHLNGGTYNLGHRHPALVAELKSALDEVDVGNHHFPSAARGELAEKLAKYTPEGLHTTVFTPSGSEANDMAIKAARWKTGRRKVVAFESAYHGNSGLSGAAGDDNNARYFGSAFEDDFVRIPFDDLNALEDALSKQDVALFMAETIPATFGFPIPSDHYYPKAREICDRHGTLLLADEVQTGLGQSGELWAIEKLGGKPDMIVTGKGLGGGLYPLAAVVMKQEIGEWLKEKGWGYVSTFGGAELGCRVASKVLDLTTAPETLARVNENARLMRARLDDVQKRRPFLSEIRQLGVIFGLGFDDSHGAVRMASVLYKQGLWAMFSGFDMRYLQFKLGLLVDEAYIDEAAEKLEAALKEI